MNSYIRLRGSVIKQNCHEYRIVIVRYLSSSLAKHGNKVLSKKYSNTLFLPRTTFPVRVEGKKRLEKDEEIFRKSSFDLHYQLQRDYRSRERSDFVLHDGPPYANGEPHMGHAVNKILKDITNRYQVSRGRRVHYVPGWDCHGLPIELKAVKGDSGKLGPGKLRQIAGKFAEAAVEKQRSQFRSWGVMADWSRPYLTMSPHYIKQQLSVFHRLYSAGHIFRSVMPVWWSPSSRTALAEAELEYSTEHRSQALYVKLRLSQLSPALASVLGGESCEVSCLVWTTTGWSLVANRAVCYSPVLQYSLLRAGAEYFLVASDLLTSPGVRASLGETEVVKTLTGTSLAGCQYWRPLYQDQQCPLLPASHVTNTAGTGLVHTAPAHGQDDFRVGIQYGLSGDCVVGEDGRYLPEAGLGLQGLEVMGEGGAKVVELLGSDVLFSETITHSYPYDWRTKKPVLLRASKQWFINTDNLKAQAMSVLAGVEIQPDTAANGFRGVVDRRPYWCISRQRVWGTFIPVIYNKHGDIVISSELIERYQHLLDTHGTSFWWELSLEEILVGTSYSPEEHQREGLDIMDIWLDSGLSWSSVLEEGQKADVYCEGLDQFSGWFYSSLLTSVALTGKAPYKKVFVHGFTLDENGNKMSKSLGNVISPHDVIVKKSLGVDVMRWWVAKHASSSASVSVSNNILQACKADLDRSYSGRVGQHYQRMEYSKVCLATLQFLARLSSDYLYLSKDRLYCEAGQGRPRLSGLSTILSITRAITGILSPVLPHLTEEAALACPALPSPFIQGWYEDSAWADPGMAAVSASLERVREELNKLESVKVSEGLAEVRVPGPIFTRLEGVPAEEVAEVLGVLGARLELGQLEQVVRLEKSRAGPCVRCRRLVAPPDEELCSRCRAVLDTL